MEAEAPQIQIGGLNFNNVSN